MQNQKSTATGGRGADEAGRADSRIAIGRLAHDQRFIGDPSLILFRIYCHSYENKDLITRSVCFVSLGDNMQKLLSPSELGHLQVNVALWRSN